MTQIKVMILENMEEIMSQWTEHQHQPCAISPGYSKEFLGELDCYSARYKSAILCFNCWVVSMSARVPWISQPSANRQSCSSSFSCRLEVSSTPPSINRKTFAPALHWLCKIVGPHISISLCRCGSLSVLILLHDQATLYPLCSAHFQILRWRRTRSRWPDAAGGNSPKCSVTIFSVNNN